MEKGKISVVVPVYNLQEYIGKTVNSIRKQTYENLEIILVDDGSKDDSPEILDKIAGQDDRVKVIHKENGGVTSARICGIKAATGDWIGFVDGDDYIEPHMYEILIDNAIKYQANISHCGYQMVFPSRVDLYYGTGKLVEQDCRTGIKDLLEGRFVEPGLWNKLYQRELFEELKVPGFFDESIKINEDLLMNYYLFKCARKSIYIDECLYHYVLRKNSAATSLLNENKLKDPLKVLKILKQETTSEREYQYIVTKRIVAQLIGQATLSLGTQKDLIMPYRRRARQDLKCMLHEIIRGPYGKKIKMQAVLTVICPIAYRCIHRVYAYITGLDKKYEVK